MRTAVAIGCAVVIVNAGAGLWMYYLSKPGDYLSKPGDYAATPGDYAATPGATAEDAAPVTRLEVHRLIHAEDFSSLTRIIEGKQAKAARDVRSEGELGAVINTFRTADTTLTPLLDRWVEAEPASYAPRLARAAHRFSLAFAERGGQLAAETSEQQFQGMAEHLKGVIEDTQAALERNPRIGEAYRILIDAARTLGNQDACGTIADRGLAQVPASLQIRGALAICRLPRWGGSYELVKAVAQGSDAHVADNPALAALHGFAEWDQGRSARGDEALPHYAAALATGEHWFFYRDRARAHLRQERYTEMLADANRGLVLAPDDSELLVLRVRAHAGLGRVADAVRDVQLLDEIDATNEDLAAFKIRELETAPAEGYRLLNEAKDAKGAIARLTAAIELTGGDAEAYYWRGRAYLQTGDRNSAQSDFEAAIEFDATHFESYRNIDYILAQQQAWDEVIRHWTEYLKLKPMDGRAYFERAGALNHKGDRTAALADARRACDLGTQEACAIVRREGGR